MAGRRRDPLGTAVGLITFLAGVGLIVMTFVLAREMFMMPAEQALNIKEGEVMDVNRALVAGTFILFRVNLLEKAESLEAAEKPHKAETA